MKANKLKSIIMLLIGIFFSISLSAFEVDGIEYEITSSTDMTVKVIKTSGGYTGKVVIPDNIFYNGVRYSVASIGYRAFYSCKTLTIVVIGNNVTSIDKNAFDSCNSLTSVTIGNSVKSIGDRAFQYCI